MKIFDVSRWEDKIIHEPTNYLILTEFVSDEEAMKCHALKAPMFTAEKIPGQGMRFSSKPLADMPELVQTGHIRLKAGAISEILATLSRHMVVLASTYIEAIIQEYLCCLFRVKPKLMHGYLSPQAEHPSSRMVSLQEVLETRQREKLLGVLADRAAANAGRGKPEKVIALVRELSDSSDFDSNLVPWINDIYAHRNKIVHEASEPKVDKRYVVQCFDVVERLLFDLGHAAEKCGVPVDDEGMLLCAFLAPLESVRK